MLRKMIAKVADEKNLSFYEAENIIDIISEGKALPTQVAALLIALKMKGETSEEITAFAKKLREKAEKINTFGIDNVVDSCGTGGDYTNTFNISTTSAILASSSGLHVAKHSNFGFSSQCGSSNVLEVLGIPLQKTPKDVEDSLKKHNIAFIHAPYFHKATASVAQVRKEIGIRTVFNFLGPLTNPTSPTGQVLGVSDSGQSLKMAETLKNLGCKRAMVVSGIEPSIDEISICGETLIYRLNNGEIDSFKIHPNDFDLNTARIEDISGGFPDTNARIIEDIFEGKIQGPKLDAVLLNTSALLWVGNKVESLEEGIKIAEELISSRKALEKLSEIKQKY